MKKKKVHTYYETHGLQSITTVLEAMEQDTRYATPSSYCSNVDEYPDHQIPFTAKHMRYLQVHQDVDPLQYLANLRLSTLRR